MKNLVAFFIFFVLLFPKVTWAMGQCVEELDIVTAYPVIFKGRVTRVEDNKGVKNIHDKIVDRLEALKDQHGEKGFGPYIWMTMFMGDPKITSFDVIETYKGVLPKKLKIYHNLDSLRGEKRRGGVSFDIGETYVVPVRVDEQGIYIPSRCNIKYTPESTHKNLARIVDVKVQKNAYDEAITRYPDMPHYVIEKGNFLERIKDFQSAEEMYTHFIEQAREQKKNTPFLKKYREGLARAITQKEQYFMTLDGIDRFYVASGWGKDIVSKIEHNFYDMLAE